ncbi:MAG: hypothetical protein QME66_02390 [Candidatus Eisenbacteria bacterium]|nr:hypothetical protein [Candidatus Eisenbacteria bacterium]
MNNTGRMRLVCRVLVLFVVGILIGCGKEKVSAPESSLGTYLFYTNASSTTPVFKPAPSAATTIQSHNVRAAATPEWGSGNPLYHVYYSLREFLSSRDEGKVDRANLYKLLIDVDQVYTGTAKDVQSIAEQEITPPFGKLQKMLCNKAVNDTANKCAIALKETSDGVNAILGWIWSDQPLKNEYGVASMSYGTASKDLTVDMTYSVDYDTGTPQTEYNLRCNVAGNAERNEFQFKYIIGDAKIVAKGVSRGEGNYMLFKYSGFGNPVKYIVVPGDADENFFIGQNGNPTYIFDDPNSLPASVAAYKDWVVNENFFTAADMVTDVTTLNSGNARQGTIYINSN